MSNCLHSNLHSRGATIVRKIVSSGIALSRMFAATLFVATVGVAGCSSEDDELMADAAAGHGGSAAADARREAAEATAGSAPTPDGSRGEDAGAMDATRDSSPPRVDAAADGSPPDVSLLDARADVRLPDDGDANRSDAGGSDAASLDGASARDADATSSDAVAVDAGDAATATPGEGGGDGGRADERDSATVAVDAASDAVRAEGGSCGNAACLACEANPLPDMGCPEYIPLCTTFTGTARAQCLALLKCVRDTSCHSVNPLACYCGTADATECLATTGVVANGACKAQIEAAQGTTNPTAIQDAYTNVANPGGSAMSIALCDWALCAEQCIPYGTSCP
jgi:hypothetical protein